MNTPILPIFRKTVRIHQRAFISGQTSNWVQLIKWERPRKYRWAGWFCVAVRSRDIHYVLKSVAGKQPAIEDYGCFF